MTRFKLHISITAFIAGSVLAVAVSVWATSIGTNIDVTGNLTVSGTSATSTFSTGGLNIGSGQFVVQQTSGNVGIGTTSPFALLSVNAPAGQASFAIGSSSATTFMVDADGRIALGTTSPRARLDSNGTIRVTNEPVEYRPNTGSGLEMIFIPSIPRGLIIAFDRAASAYRRLDINDLITFSGGASANVGISDTDPDALLEVSASAGASDLFMLSSDDGNDGNRFIVKNSGNVGIGTTSPYALLSVEANTTATDLFAVGDTGTSSPLFVVKGSGNVGIGTTSPGTTLATEGNIFVSNTSTSTLLLNSQHGTRGGCIQLEGPASTTFRLYATSTGPAIFESGACQ